MAKKPAKQIITTLSFPTKKELKECQRKARVNHSGLSQCTRDLFKAYNPNKS